MREENCYILEVVPLMTDGPCSRPNFSNMPMKASQSEIIKIATKKAMFHRFATV